MRRYRWGVESETGRMGYGVAGTPAGRGFCQIDDLKPHRGEVERHGGKGWQSMGASIVGLHRAALADLAIIVVTSVSTLGGDLFACHGDGPQGLGSLGRAGGGPQLLIDWRRVLSRRRPRGLEPRRVWRSGRSDVAAPVVGAAMQRLISPKSGGGKSWTIGRVSGGGGPGRMCITRWPLPFLEATRVCRSVP